jgi:peptidoglycan/xylan/chitin deacetylase (PgdA/CDA1 family)
MAAAHGYQKLMRVPVLLFHDVSTETAGKYPGITISPARFRELMARLATRGYSGISARDWLYARDTGQGLPNKPVLITFDDAYRSIAEHALPILAAYGFRATVFVVTDLIGRSNEWDRPRWRGLPLMDLQQIRAWSTRGMEFGSHGTRHHDLTALAAEELLHEIQSSQHQLASVVGAPIVSFAYPFGRYNGAVQRVVAETYRLAFTIEQGTLNLKTSPMRCCRTEVMPNYTPLRVELYLRFASVVGVWGRLSRSLRLLTHRLLAINTAPSATPSPGYISHIPQTHPPDGLDKGLDQPNYQSNA